jgi:hypothetical protein
MATTKIQPVEFVTASKKVEFVAIGVRGPTKAGKSVTAAMEAIYIAKTYHPKGTPVSWVPTEPGLDFILDMFAAEGVPVLEPKHRSRSFETLKGSIPGALNAGAGVILIDNLTHFRDELVKTYKRDHNITRKLKPFEYGPINDMWNEWTSEMLVGGIDKILLGRIGNIFEELEDEDGESEMKTIGKKMKAGNDTEYELDLLIEMSSRPDTEAPNAVSVPKLGKPDGNGDRKVVGRKLKRTFTSNKLHIMTVTDSRISELSGQALVMKSYKGYKAGLCNEVGKFLDPYVKFVKSGPKGTQAQVVDLKPGQAMFVQGENNGTYVRKQKTLERFKTTMDIIFPDRSVLTKQRRMFVGEQVTNGIRSPKEFAAQDADALDFQYLILQKFEQRLKQEGMPDTLEPGLKYLTDLARLEAEEDWKVFHPAVQPLTSEQEAEEAEMPF